MKLIEPSFKNFTQNFVEIVDKIATLLGRLIILNVQSINKFFDVGRVDSHRFLVDLVLRARSLNVIVTNKSRIWRSMWIVMGSPGLSSITDWSSEEQHLGSHREILIFIYWGPKHMTNLNKIAEDATYGSLSPADHDKYINVEMPKIHQSQGQI